jgi:predicted dehydrogenase
MINIAIIGFGNRGTVYTDIIEQNKNTMKLVAVCDIAEDKRTHAKDFMDKDGQIFDSVESLYAKGKIADILIIASQDRSHFEHIMPALKLGYDILLEKPISINKEECIKIEETANQYNCRVIIAHVLRYTPFYTKLKEIVESGILGQVATINQTENVGFWHMAHSYVRGNWRNSNTSSPMILAKCCHDLDIIKWLINKKCETISSFGNLMFFNKENQPKGAENFCYKCKIDCPYRASTFYKANKGWLRSAGMSFDLVLTDENVAKYLSDENNPYARCVFDSDNNVVDHQVVNMLFDGGATAHLTMTAFSKDCRRTIKIHGTLGDVIGDMEAMTIKVELYGKETYEIDVRNLATDFSNHGGGDRILFEEFVKFISGKNGSTNSSLSNSVESHLMAFAAEESRLKSGMPITIR